MIRRVVVRWAAVAALAAVLVPLAPSGAVAQGKAITVYLVRHAEKGTTPPSDPPLTPAGEARAEALAKLLADSGVTAAITTDLVRTRATAAPIVAARKLTPVVVGVRVAPAAHIAAVADAVRAAGGGVVLVVGHSNTIPKIVEALGGPALPDLCDAAYANLFVVRLEPGKPAKFSRAKFGAPDPDGSDSCPQMKP